MFTRSSSWRISLNGQELIFYFHVNVGITISYVRYGTQGTFQSFHSIENGLLWVLGFKEMHSEHAALCKKWSTSPWGLREADPVHRHPWRPSWGSAERIFQNLLACIKVRVKKLNMKDWNVRKVMPSKHNIYIYMTAHMIQVFIVCYQRNRNHCLQWFEIPSAIMCN